MHYAYSMMAITITDITALIGVVFGTGALVLGILNYLRDRPKVDVVLQWNMRAIPETALPPDQRECGIITVTNSGRRPVYISHVCLKVPRHYGKDTLLLVDSVEGHKLSEGDPGVRFIVPYKGLAKYSKDWQKIRAQVSDSTGKVWASKRRRLQKPEWVTKDA
jgi:hypothetical protein